MSTAIDSVPALVSGTTIRDEIVEAFAAHRVAMTVYGVSGAFDGEHLGRLEGGDQLVDLPFIQRFIIGEPVRLVRAVDEFQIVKVV